MAVITDNPVWVAGITQIDPNDPVQGGKGGVDNVPHEQLANRTAYLKKEVESIIGETTEPMSLEALLQRIKDLETAPAITVPVLPVGALFETTVVYTSGSEVGEAIGYGTWQPFAEGRVTVGVSSKVDDPDWTKVIGNEHGEYEHILTVEQIPSHAHELGISAQTRVSHDDSQETDRPVDATGEKKAGYVGNTGGDQPHNNVQPSVVVGKWVRTA